MSNKVYSAKEAALAVLKKTEELLKKSEVLAKYETENSKKLGYKPFDVKQQDTDRADKAFKVEKQSAKSSDDSRQAKQMSPGSNPKEEAEGNNQSDGMEPRYEFKDKVKKELAKENVGHMGKSEMKKKYEGFKAVEESARESGASDPAAVAASAGRKKYGKEAFQAAAAKGKKMKKNEMDKDGLSPEEIAHRLDKTGLSSEQIRAHLDKAATYPKELASKDIEQNMKHKDEWPGGAKQAIAVGINEAKAGKDVSEKKAEDTSHAEDFMPIKHHVSAKLAKFMEWKHHKNKMKGSK